MNVNSFNIVLINKFVSLHPSLWKEEFFFFLDCYMKKVVTFLSFVVYWIDSKVLIGVLPLFWMLVTFFSVVTFFVFFF